MENNEEKTRFRLRQGTRNQVEVDGAQIGLGYPVHNYAGELYYDTTDGHLWISDGVSQTKVDVRGLLFDKDGEVVCDEDGEALFW